MQVVLQTPSEIVVHDSPLPMVITGALFSTVGFGFIWLLRAHPDGWSGNGGPWVVYVVGGIFGIAGLAILYFAADRNFIVDRSAKNVRIVVQRLLHRQTTNLPFDKIDDVALEETAAMQTNPNSNLQGAPTYRVVFMMKDGTRVPWTPYSTNMRVTQESCAAAVRTFGGWSGRPDHPVPPSIAAPSLISHPAATNWGCFAAFLSMFAAVGLGIFSLQIYRIMTYEPIKATVYSTGVKVVPGNKGGSTYAPVVSYGYYYDGTAHYSTQVHPIQISASRSWADGITRQYPAGSVITAYISASNPDKAFLVRMPSLIPLLFVAFPLFFGLLMSWLIKSQRAQVAFGEQHLVPVVKAVARSSG